MLMKKLALFLIAAFILAAAILPAISADKTPPFKGARLIKGTLVDSNDKPVAHTKVQVMLNSNGKEKKLILTTDKNGIFRFPIEPTQNVNYGFISSLAKDAAISSNYFNPKSSEELKIVQWRGFTFKGRVVDENGQPIEGATIIANDFYGYGNNKNAQCNLPENLSKTTTGKDGSFAIEHVLNPDDFEYVSGSFNVMKSGRAHIHLWLRKENIRSGLEVKDPPECKIDGVLYLPDKTGFAPKDTRLSVEVDMQGSGRESRQTAVGEKGEFHFTELPPGKVNVTLASDGWSYGPDNKPSFPKPKEWALPASMNVEISPQKPTALELVLVKGSLIKGILTDKTTGKPVSGARISITHGGKPSGSFSDYTGTDDNGEFQARVVSGDVNLSIEEIREANGNSHWIQEEDRPSLSFKAATGEDKTDIAFKMDPISDRNSMYEVANKPAPDDFELKAGTYNLTWDPDVTNSETGYSAGRYQGKDVVSRIKKMPTLVSSKATKMAFNLDGNGDDGLLFVLLDESKGEGKGWDTAYVDMNRNGDLTDDKPLSFSIGSNRNSARTEWFTVQAHQGAPGSERTDHPFQMQLSILMSSGRIFIMPQRKGAWKGLIDSNKGKVECITADDSCNGKYNDIGMIKDNFDIVGWGDELFIDTNGYGKAITLGYGPQAIRLYKLSQVVKKFYNIKVSDLGDKVTIEPYTGPTGQLLVQAGDVQGMKGIAGTMTIVGENGYYSCDGCEKLPPLPVGKYKVSTCSMNLEDKNGKKLNISCAPDGIQNVEADKKTTVNISGNFSLAINPEKKEIVYKPGNTETVVWDVKIGDNTSVSSIGDRYRGDAPKVSFYDKKGKLLNTVTAGYT